MNWTSSAIHFLNLTASASAAWAASIVKGSFPELFLSAPLKKSLWAIGDSRRGAPYALTW
jgi:hypothetical protein